jgi:hypothetical protein
VGDPTDLDVADAQTQHAVRRVRTSYPGVVVAYFPTGPLAGRAKVTLGQTGQTSEGIIDPPIILPAVPVVWPKGDVGRLDPGDEVVVAVCARSLDRWLAVGGPAVPLETDRMHDLLDALALPTRGFSTVKPPPPAAATAHVHGREDGTATILTTYAPLPAMVTIESPAPASIKLGATAVEQIALGPSLVAWLTTIITASAVVATDGGAAFKANLLLQIGLHPFTEFSTVKAVAE